MYRTFLSAYHEKFHHNIRYKMSPLIASAAHRSKRFPQSLAPRHHIDIISRATEHALIGLVCNTFGENTRQAAHREPSQLWCGACGTSLIFYLLPKFHKHLGHQKTADAFLLHVDRTLSGMLWVYVMLSLRNRNEWRPNFLNQLGAGMNRKDHTPKVTLGERTSENERELYAAPYVALASI